MHIGYLDIFWKYKATKLAKLVAVSSSSSYQISIEDKKDQATLIKKRNQIKIYMQELALFNLKYEQKAHEPHRSPE